LMEMAGSIPSSEATALALQGGTGAPIVLDVGGVGYLVLVALVRKTGLLLVVPIGMLAERRRRRCGRGRGVEAVEAVALCDFEDSALAFLFTKENWASDVVDFRQAVNGPYVPTKALLMPKVKKWVADQWDAGSEDLTAEEVKLPLSGRGKKAKPEGAGAGAGAVDPVLLQLQQIAVQFGRFEVYLQGMCSRLESLEDRGSVASQMTGRVTPPFMDDLASVVPRRPCSLEMGSEGSGRGRVDREKVKIAEDAADEDEEEEEEPAGGGADFDQAMRVAMMEFLKEKQNKKKKKIPGLPEYEGAAVQRTLRGKLTQDPRIRLLTSICGCP
jgi:hypothetical protein